VESGDDPRTRTGEGEKEGERNLGQGGRRTEREENPRLGKRMLDEPTESRKCLESSWDPGVGTRPRAPRIDRIYAPKSSRGGKKGGEKSRDSDRRDCGFGLSICGEVDLPDPRKRGLKDRAKKKDEKARKKERPCGGGRGKEAGLKQEKKRREDANQTKSIQSLWTLGL
jgi:hypothetical protein